MNTKRVFGFLVLSVILVSLVAGIVSAESILDKIINGITSSTSGADAFNLGKLLSSVGFAKILMFVLIALIVYSISSFLPFISEKGWIAGGISIVIGILSVMFLKNEEVYAALLSYGAMGLVLTAIIPFIIIAVISKRLNEPPHSYPLLAKILWVVFIAVLFFRWVAADSSELGKFGTWAFPVVMFLAFVMFIWEKRMWFYLFRKQLGEYREEYKKGSMANVLAKLEDLRDKISNTRSEQVKAELIPQHDRLAKTYRQMGGDWGDWGK